MDEATFDAVLARRLKLTHATLGKKAGEYAMPADRLHNFQSAAALLRCTPEQACWGFLAKHLVSLGDMVASGRVHDRAAWDEKVGDAINYLVLLEAITLEGEE